MVCGAAPGRGKDSAWSGRCRVPPRIGSGDPADGPPGAQDRLLPTPGVRARRAARDHAAAVTRVAAAAVPRVPHNPSVTEDQLRTFVADLLLTGVFVAVFLALLALHRLDLRRRRGRVAALRRAGDFGPRSGAVADVVAAAAELDAAAAAALAAERRRSFEWDPRLTRPPKAARQARDRAFASERDDVARAAAEEARDAAARALAGAAIDEPVRAEAAESAAEAAAAIVAADRITAAEFRMLTRAWRTVVGPVRASPRREP